MASIVGAAALAEGPSAPPPYSINPSVPEWETGDTNLENQQVHSTISSWTATLRSKFDKILPPDKRYFTLNRKAFVLVLAAIMISSIALIAGLAVGLTVGKPVADNRPFHGGKATTGDMTYYDPGLGACGISSSSSDLIVAVSGQVFDPQTPNGNPNNNPLCGRKIRVSRNGKTVDVTLVDRCASCQANGIDVSPTAFSKLADQSLGRVTVDWVWL